jgi:hypothetical protein
VYPFGGGGGGVLTSAFGAESLSSLRCAAFSSDVLIKSFLTTSSWTGLYLTAWLRLILVTATTTDTTIVSTHLITLFFQANGS